MDQWSYYQDGFEVYREIDLDGDRSLDEARWLNAGGTRVAAVTKGKIVGWKQISAEEASKVFVQGLVQAQANGDLSLLETVMATPAELAAVGLPKDVTDRVAAAAASRAEKVDALLKGLVGWNAQTVWNRFDGTFPHVIPADPSGGLEKDVMVYENATIFAGTANLAANAAASQDRLPPDPRHDQAGRHLEVHRAAGRHRPGEADGGVGQRYSRDALRPGEQRPAARRGGGRGPQGPGRLRHQERGLAPGRPSRHREISRRPHPASCARW